MQKNIAVVGCGHWGKNLVRNFSELGALACVCDPDVEQAEFLAKKFNVENARFSEVIINSDIKGVVLAVPAPLHASMAIEVMQAGKNVYVEKPLAMNETDAQQMIDASKSNEVHLMVGHLLQYHPVFSALRKMVIDGSLGKLNYLYSNRLSLGKIRSEEDVVWSFAPHDISMILSLVDKKPTSVRTESTAILQPGLADTATLHIEFEEGPKAHVAVSWLHPYKEQKLVVIGEEAMAVFDDTQPWEKKLALYKHQIDFSGSPPKPKKADIEYVDVRQAEPLKEECRYFVKLIEGNEPPLTDGEEGLRVLKVLAASTLSQTEARLVRLGDDV